jgi:outer membrane protein W
MKRTILMIMAASLIILLTSPNSYAKKAARTAGIGIRGSYWNMSNVDNSFKVQTSPNYTEVDIGGGGGYLFFLTRMNERWMAELSVGAVGQVQTRTVNWDNEDVHVSAITPILLGFRNELTFMGNSDQLQPYFSFGVGPYWISNIHVEEKYFGCDEEVTVRSKIKPGGYLGGGVNFMMSSWFGLNFDAKYHFVDFNRNYDRSGYECGLGIMFMWGKYNPE